MAIIITTEPIDVNVNGVTFQMQADPTASPEWGILLETEVTYGTNREESHTKLVEALAALAQTPEDAETIRGLDVGTRTLKVTAERYVQEVAGFPTKPAANSKKR